MTSHRQGLSDKYHAVSLICGIEDTTPVNLSAQWKQTRTQRTDCGCQAEGVGNGRIESLGLPVANYYIRDG